MLDVLRIKNLALIEDLEMEFSPGLNVLTGETGAGKSFILRALSFVTGERLSVDLVRPGAEKAVVEALFFLEGEDLIIRRELFTDSGRSRLYINDKLSSLETAEELKASLIIHTSQHGQQRLLQPSYQAAMLDSFLGQPELIKKRDEILHKLLEIGRKIKKLDEDVALFKEKREILEYQQSEIEKVNPKENEEEELEKEREAFRNKADLSEYTDLALGVIHGDDEGPGILDRLSALEKSVSYLASLDIDAFENSVETLQDAGAEILDLGAKLRKVSERSRVDLDIDKIESRLYSLAQLKRRLKRPMSAILSLRAEIEETLDFLDNSEIDRRELEKEEEEVCAELSQHLIVLNKARKKAGEAFCKIMRDELRTLGFSEHIDVAFSYTPQSLYKDREDCLEDKARLLWMPNPGQAPQPLDKIASGGELSRFLLAAVTVMSRKSGESPSLIFDEVDSGVGGLTLNSVAKSLADLAKSRQLLVITHWPQLAAKAENHFFIQKDIIEGQTYTSCSRLDEEGVTEELARMAGGGEQGSAFARELQLPIS